MLLQCTTYHVTFRFAFLTGHQLHDMKIDDLVRSRVQLHYVILIYLRLCNMYPARDRAVTALFHYLRRYLLQCTLRSANRRTYVISCGHGLSRKCDRACMCLSRVMLSCVIDLCPMVAAAACSTTRRGATHRTGHTAHPKLANILFAKELARRCGHAV